ncbi:PstA family ABC transporter permease [Roseateles sp. LKC17W]|uniref:PstA family ABC transporter permease n=1 Tax=Pelomonas margarita TaxID=3299031 RepID=A0ABW7FE29_9BURK
MNRRRLVPWGDQLAFSLVAAVSLAAILMLTWPLVTVLVHGIPALSLDFLLDAPSDAGRSGGIGPILVSTLAIVGLSLLLALPMAFATAVILTEVLPADAFIARVMRSSLDILAGVPSVVFGLFGLSLFCRQLGLGYSIAAGGATLACMVLPTLTRSLVSALHAIGAQHRMAGSALGLSRATVLWFVTLPVALPGIAAAIILALTRALAETALLLFTSGYSDRMPESVMDSGRSISVHIYELSTNVPGGIGNAYGSALALLLLLAGLGLTLHMGTHWTLRRLTGRPAALDRKSR